MIRNGEAQFVINTFTKGKQPERDGFRIRREAVENGVACLTSLDTAEAILRVIESMNFSAEAMEKPIEERGRLFINDNDKKMYGRFTNGNCRLLFLNYLKR